MIGTPRVCKTASDYERIYQMAKEGKLPKQEVLNHLQGLLNTREKYVFDRVLEDSEEPDGDSPQYTVVERELEDGTVERRQNKLEEDPNGRIFKLGFSVENIQKRIDDLEV